VNEDRLRERLRREPVPDEAAAEDRAWNVVRSAYDARTAMPPKPRLGRLAIALAGAALLAALLLSPAGAAVRDWIHDVVEGEDHAAPSLTSLPAPGRILVESKLGPWIVQADGSKRLLGAYGQAAFSPHGRYVAVTDGRDLAAVVADAVAVGQPEGTPHWTVPASGPVSDPAWAPSGIRVAYVSGDELRVVGGDGKQDRRIANSVAPVAPAWKPLSPGEAQCVEPATGVANCARNVIAYVDPGRRLHVVDVDSGTELLRRTPDALPGVVTDLAWSPDGHRLLVLGDQFAAVVRPDGSFAGKLLASGDAGSFSPSGDSVAVVERQQRPGGVHSVVTLITNLKDGGEPRRLYGGPGTLTDLTWSPNGRWLLVAYPGADQWVFIPVGHHGDPQPVAGIADEFDAGSRGRPAAFPRVTGWIDG
jgi:WD40 repeat protein